jgi:hypothetical protein
MTDNIWDVTRGTKSLYGAGSLVRVSKELSKYKLDIEGVQEVSGMAVAPNQQENTNFAKN